MVNYMHNGGLDLIQILVSHVFLQGGWVGRWGHLFLKLNVYPSCYCLSRTKFSCPTGFLSCLIWVVMHTRTRLLTNFRNGTFASKLFHGILSYVTVCMFFLMLHLFFNFFFFYDSHMKAKHIYSSQFCIHCVYIYTFSVLWSLLLRLPSNSGNSLTASYLMGVPCMMNASCTLIKWSLTFEKSFSFSP